MITLDHQPRAEAALSAALANGPSHAYLFRGPRGSGKRVAARAFAAEILAGAAPDPEDARRRALLDPSPHPDLVWLAPTGAQHLVDEVRERVIRAAAYRPFEGHKRVFVVAAAEAMRDESQNALLKTLEEPPAFVHLILLSAEPAALLETVASRCQAVDFAPLPPEAVEAALAGEPPADGPKSQTGVDKSARRHAPDEIAAAARLSGGDRGEIAEPGRGEAEADVEQLGAATTTGALGLIGDVAGGALEAGLFLGLEPLADHRLDGLAGGLGVGEEPLAVGVDRVGAQLAPLLAE
ncbi:MAG TPA: hypothetical protein VFU04_02240, partial [Solirubrobacterales bacterium]|nr:hypothetical protein [Solirubrobacterales bacterium]